MTLRRLRPHLVDADHARCAADLRRELRSFHRADPDGQFWTEAMADTLLAALDIRTQLFSAGAWPPPAAASAEQLYERLPRQIIAESTQTDA